MRGSVMARSVHGRHADDLTTDVRTSIRPSTALFLGAPPLPGRLVHAPFNQHSGRRALAGTATTSPWTGPHPACPATAAQQGT